MAVIVCAFVAHISTGTLLEVARVLCVLKVRHPAVTGVYCIVRDSRSGCSNDFKCTCS